MTVQEAFNKFIYAKRVCGVSKKTIESYSDILHVFIKYTGSNCPMEHISLSLVEKYILNLYNTDLSRATISTYIRNVRIFLKWYSIEYELSFNPLKIKVPKSPKKKVHIYSTDEIKLIFDSIQTSTPWITARNVAMVAMMLDSGIRQCELCRLLHSCIDKPRHVMTVTGKGAKERFVPIGDFALKCLDTYNSLCPLQSDHVFLYKDGKPLSGNAVRLFTYKLQKNLPFKFSSHRLRHNFATNYCLDQFRETGKTDVYDLSILMGHESMETTKKYEHFAHEIIAVETNISHLDKIFKNNFDTLMI